MAVKIPAGYEEVVDPNYALQKGDLYWYAYSEVYDMVYGLAGTILGEENANWGKDSKYIMHAARKKKVNEEINNLTEINYNSWTLKAPSIDAINLGGFISIEPKPYPDILEDYELITDEDYLIKEGDICTSEYFGGAWHPVVNSVGKTIGGHKDLMATQGTSTKSFFVCRRKHVAKIPDDCPAILEGYSFVTDDNHIYKRADDRAFITAWNKDDGWHELLGFNNRTFEFIKNSFRPNYRAYLITRNKQNNNNPIKNVAGVPVFTKTAQKTYRPHEIPDGYMLLPVDREENHCLVENDYYIMDGHGNWQFSGALRNKYVARLKERYTGFRVAIKKPKFETDKPYPYGY